MDGSRLREKGKNLEHSYATETHLSVKNVNARAAAAYFGLKNLPVESVASIAAAWAAVARTILNLDEFITKE